MVKYAKTPDGHQRFHCQNPSYPRRTLLMEYTHRGFLEAIKQNIVDLGIHGSGLRDSVRGLGISPTTVIDTFKQSRRHHSVTRAALALLPPCTGHRGHPTNR